MGTKKTILIDGNWNLKRNFKSPARMGLKGADGKNCGGTFGFLDSLKSVIDKQMPDRVIVAWDGFNAGKMRYNIYKPYKAKRDKDFENESRVIATEGIGNADDTEKFDFLIQKIDTQMYLDELYIRQLEVDYVEADDLIAYYILNSTDDDEHIYIYSRDNDFFHLISDKVSIINPDYEFTLTIDNFRELVGYTLDNALLFKCFEGDSSDGIEGVNGITSNTIMEYFPDSRDEKYTLNRLITEGNVIQESRISGKPKKKRLIKVDKIMESEYVLYRNAKLINLKKPFLSQEAIDSVDAVRTQALESDRSVDEAMKMFANAGFLNFVEGANPAYFFGPFYSLMSKEKEFETTLK